MSTIPEVELLDRAYKALKNLLDQHWRQLNVEEAGGRASYPGCKFPDWGQAWEQADRTMWDIEGYMMEQERAE